MNKQREEKIPDARLAKLSQVVWDDLTVIRIKS